MSGSGFPRAYVADLFSYCRRPSREVMVGNLGFGGSHPIRVQSMITSDTMDTVACVEQTLRLVEAGCEMVRITAPTVKDAANLDNIRAALDAAGCHVPLVADIHFKPEAALEAVRWVEKVRINPGNFADSKKFSVRDYSDAEYAAELDRIRERFTPLVKLCQERGVAMRIGTNHGSLSDRIMNRFGDSPRGMVESALEFARIARDLDYHRFVFSMKASNPKVMIAAYRLLVERLDQEGPDWNYPIHLGVTEAGDGEDGRIKSAIGIGSLLSDGIGDTIRVSLTEDSHHEIPVARALIAPFRNRPAEASPVEGVGPAWDPFDYSRRSSERIELRGISGSVALGGGELVRVAVPLRVDEAVAHKRAGLGDYQPELIHEDLPLVEVDPLSEEETDAVNAVTEPRLVTVRDGVALSPIAAFRLLACRVDPRHPILIKDTLSPRERVSSPITCFPARLFWDLSSATGSAMPSSFATRKPPVSPCDSLTTFSRQEVSESSRRITSPAPPADALSSIFRRPPVASRRPRDTSRGSASPSWDASSTAPAKWPTPTSAMSGVPPAR